MFFLTHNDLSYFLSSVFVSLKYFMSKLKVIVLTRHTAIRQNIMKITFIYFKINNTRLIIFFNYRFLILPAIYKINAWKKLKVGLSISKKMVLFASMKSLEKWWQFFLFHLKSFFRFQDIWLFFLTKRHVGETAWLER